MIYKFQWVIQPGDFWVGPSDFNRQFRARTQLSKSINVRVLVTAIINDGNIYMNNCSGILTE